MKAKDTKHGIKFKVNHYLVSYFGCNSLDFSIKYKKTLLNFNSAVRFYSNII